MSPVAAENRPFPPLRQNWRRPKKTRPRPKTRVQVLEAAQKDFERQMEALKQALAQHKQALDTATAEKTELVAQFETELAEARAAHAKDKETHEAADRGHAKDREELLAQACPRE